MAILTKTVKAIQNHQCGGWLALTIVFIFFHATTSKASLQQSKPSTSIQAKKKPAPKKKKETGPQLVRRKLTSLKNRRLIAANEYQQYQQTYNQSIKTAQFLQGRQKNELVAVIKNVERFAAANQFTNSRLRSIFLTLQVNEQFWKTQPIPAKYARFTLQSNPLIWQYYPGQGLEIHWLATFSAASNLASTVTEAKATELRKLLDAATFYAVQQPNGIAWEALFSFSNGAPPWRSGMYQATAIQTFVRATRNLGEPKYLDAATKALGLFLLPPPQGVRLQLPTGNHYLLYSNSPNQFVLNAFTQTLNGLYDYAAITQNPTAMQLFRDGERELRTELPGYDTGSWSRYSLNGPLSTPDYHRLARDFLVGLCTRLTSDLTAGPNRVVRDIDLDPTPYCEMANRLTSYLG